ncbi:hypothetical protein L195_g050732, partial [Trifolium pratense]
GLLRSASLKGQDRLYFGTDFSSFYVPVIVLRLFCSKELLCMLLVPGVVGTWFWFCVGG